MVSEVAASQREIEPTWSCHSVEIEPGRVKCVCGVLSRGEHFLAVDLLIRGKPQFGSRPIEVVLQLVVGVRTAAEPGVIVRCDQVGMAPGRVVRGAGRFQQRSRVSGLSGTEQPSALCGNGGQMQSRRCRGPMQYSFGGVLVCPARHR